MKVLTLWQSIKFLEKNKIPFAKSFLAKNEKEVFKFANEIGFPFFMKISSPQIIHKTEAKALEIVNSEIEIRKSFERLISISKKMNAKIEGIVVQEMIKGLELIVGSKKDYQFGQTILFGLGGIFTEIYKDFSIRLIPISENDAIEMIKETKAYEILSGFRGEKYDINAIKNFLLKISKILEKNEKIIELDINPLFALKKNCFAADARIVME